MVYRSYGSPVEMAEVPDPVAGPGEVLIAVRTSSVNPVDWKVARGDIRLFTRYPFPRIPGLDVAGEVAAVGPGVQGRTVGERVHARIGALTSGASAERVAVEASRVVPMPDSMDFATAAAIPLAGMTALQALRDHAKVPMSGARERVLIVGASGGVGHLAVQLAATTGARVVGVCSGRNAALVRELGAHDVVDYTAADAAAALARQGPFDVIVDCVAGAPGPWLGLLAPGGRYATVVPEPWSFVRMLANPFTSRKVLPVLLQPNGPDLRALDDLYTAGRLRAVIDRRYPLAALGEAWERSKSGRSVGKLVIDVAEGPA